MGNFRGSGKIEGHRRTSQTDCPGRIWDLLPQIRRTVAAMGGKYCHTNSSANKFQPCTTDADCGGTVNGCQQSPWITADGITLPFQLP